MLLLANVCSLESTVNRTIMRLDHFVAFDTGLVYNLTSFATEGLVNHPVTLSRVMDIIWISADLSALQRSLLVLFFDVCSRHGDCV
jgi:hypothetical protein